MVVAVRPGDGLPHAVISWMICQAVQSNTLNLVELASIASPCGSCNHLAYLLPVLELYLARHDIRPLAVNGLNFPPCADSIHHLAKSAAKISPAVLEALEALDTVNCV